MDHFRKNSHVLSRIMIAAMIRHPTSPPPQFAARKLSVSSRPPFHDN